MIADFAVVENRPDGHDSFFTSAPRPSWFIVHLGSGEDKQQNGNRF